MQVGKFRAASLPVSDAEMQVVCTLVHGIWARKAPWMQPGSLLRETLRERLPSVDFKPFDWNGRNGLLSRVHAAWELQAHLHRLIDEHPTARHFIIAHSHGGNVALSALHDGYILDRVSGMVCLSTPFLSAQPRPHGRDLLLAILVTGYCLLFGLAFYFAFLREGLSWWSAALLVVLANIIGILPIGLTPNGTTCRRS